MRIQSIEAHNIKGYENFSESFGDVNIIAGTNGSGKTSVLSFVTGLAGKGNPKMLRPGCENGWIKARILADDGAEYWDIERIFEPGKVKAPTVESSITGRMGGSKSPVTAAKFLEQIMDSISIEPINRAMAADEAEQCRILLDTIPMKLEPGELDGAVKAVDVSDVPGLSAHLKNAEKMASGLDAIRQVHTAIYDHRRNVNRDAKTKSTHAGQLLDSIPKTKTDAGEDIDWRAQLAQLNASIKEWTESFSSAKVALERELGEVRATLKAADQLVLDKIDDEINAKIRQLEQERATRREAQAKLTESDKEKLAKAHVDQLEEISKQYIPQIQQLNEDRAVAEKNLGEKAGHDRTREIAMAAANESDVLMQKSEKMTTALVELDKLEAVLVSRIPIKGLAVKDGKIFMDGMPFSEKNTAERAKFWLRIAVMRAGELGVICMDGAEAFDANTMKAVVSACLKTGLQWFLGRVDDQPFRIEKIEAEG